MWVFTFTRCRAQAFCCNRWSLTCGLLGDKDGWCVARVVPCRLRRWSTSPFAEELHYLKAVPMFLVPLVTQELKGNYRAWNTRPPISPVHRGMVAGNGGLVPLPNGEWHVMAMDPNAPPPEVRVLRNVGHLSVDRVKCRLPMMWVPLS